MNNYHHVSSIISVILDVKDSVLLGTHLDPGLVELSVKFQLAYHYYYDHRYGCLRFNAGNTEEEEVSLSSWGMSSALPV
jgi:hypothetical protein